MHVLGIETSCDETGLALLELIPGPAEKPEQGCKAKLLGHALHSQTEMHERYGGVVPELASRDHMVRILPLLDECLRQAQFDLRDIDSIGVTQGPGLAGALWVGTSFAYGLGLAIGKPVHPVHHLEGHLLSPLLHLVGETDQASSEHSAQLIPSFPFVALLVSGGHSQFLEVTGIGEYKLLGETIDDAAGEAFDKSAQLLGLGYPGGPAVARLAEGGVPGRFRLPRPLLRKQGLDLSFAGLKTAVLTQVQKLGGTQALLKTDAQTCQTRADLAAEVQAAIVELLCEKSMAALDQTGHSQLVVSGGVSANKEMRKRLFQAAEKRAARVFFPPPALCTDNGVMIAWAAGLRLLSGLKRSETDRPARTPGHDVEGRVLGMQVRPRWPLEDLR
ncbi:MAG: tRNA (adenosine(37)-N6)-threonylcarbamoyltransferase complex transferase subunit TsaD [Burkholderiaceae bacterium]|nr:tRNA (adenosine(37)-N6)-threonylcarbamoyltransferase complex transferase subunit TsaD [Burkholderiaceae bacterium]